MHGDDLKNNPLSEAIFELRWQLQGGPPPAPQLDPRYKLLVGSLYGRVSDEYPFPEQLDTARVPDEMVPYLMQHRFRPAPDGYPLLQVGPGVFAVNQSGGGYSWKTFQPRIVRAVASLREAYPGDFKVVQFLLRYINTVPFDFSTDNGLEFLERKLKVGITYPEELFRGQPVDRRPNTVMLQTTHTLTKPNGQGTIQVASALVNGESRLLWEVNVLSGSNDVPTLDGLEKWLEEAHAVARAWFFALIEGDLEERFNA